MSRGICRDRSDIFHLRKNGASSARTITDKSGLSRSTLEFRGRSTDTVRFSRLRGASFMRFFGSQSLVDLRYLASFFLLHFCLYLDTFVARTFRMAFNRRLEPSRGGCGRQWRLGCREKKKKPDGSRRALPRDNVDKNASTGRGFIKYFTEERQVTGEITFAFEHVQAI